MNRHFVVAAIAVLCIGLFCTYPYLGNQAQAQGKGTPIERKIAVLSPMGTPPALFAEIKEKADAVIMGLGY
jgi:hypothetical protein